MPCTIFYLYIYICNHIYNFLYKNFYIYIKLYIYIKFYDTKCEQIEILLRSLILLSNVISLRPNESLSRLFIFLVYTKRLG